MTPSPDSTVQPPASLPMVYRHVNRQRSVERIVFMEHTIVSGAGDCQHVFLDQASHGFDAVSAVSLSG